MAVRYAVYVTPARESALWRFGSSVVGYDAATGDDLVQWPDERLERYLDDDTQAGPRSYGFHGTLKAPFELAGGRTAGDLLDAARTFAWTQQIFAVPKLKLAALGDFLALVPDPDCFRLNALADACVRFFEPFRSPLSAADRERRSQAPLSERQAAHLDAWGYPYVFDEFRYHMTLTGRLDPARSAAVQPILASAYAAIAEPMRVDAISVLAQPSREARFRILQRFDFAAG